MQMNRQEILFYYESEQNPNGDPGFDNQPRLLSDDRIIVTDVRIKRTMREYAKMHKGGTLFVDYNKHDIPVSAFEKMEEILSSVKDDDDVIKSLLLKTYDVPLFGALIPNTTNKKVVKWGSKKLTGPLQFGVAKSVNKVNIISPQITSRFTGRTKNESTIGKFHRVEYALIKVNGVLDPSNLGDYGKDEEGNKEVLNRFTEIVSEIDECLWDGTNNLVTRSKYPQSSILYINISYKDNKAYNDLPKLVKENDDLKGMAKELGKTPFNFQTFIETMIKRKNMIDKIKIKCSDVIDKNVNDLISNLKSNSIPVERIPT
jgi:CRISPR-associated protein Csh2